VHAAAAGLFVLGGVLYALVVHWSARRGVTVWDPSIALDRSIPVVPWSVLAYISYYLYFPLLLLLCARDDVGRRELLAVCQGLILIGAVSLSVFVLLPCEVHIADQVRAAVGSMDELPGSLFASIYLVDEPFNAWPSLHASLSLVILLHALTHLRGRLLRPGAWLAWAAMMISILTTKQHFLFDLLTGVLLGAVTWRWYVRRRLTPGTSDQIP